MLNQWLDSARQARRPVCSTGEDLMHAVSRGAAYYGLARHGKGVRIRGGVARTYYVGIETSMPAVPGLPAPLKALTVAPFGMEEGTDHKFPDREFGLIVGEPAEFRFFTSAARKNDAPGDMLEDVRRELEELSPVEVNLRPKDDAGADRARVARNRGHRNGHAAALVCRQRRPPLEARVQCARASARMNVGIDLGTTNSALAYIDPAEAEERDFPPIHILEIPQHVRQDAVEPQRTLPSFLFLGDDQTYTGVYAREQGALVPTKPVHSAKSWLSNPDVDRTAKILPWDAQEAGRVLSPVEVSAQYLQHFREAWESAARRAAQRRRTSCSPCPRPSTKKRAS